MGEITLTVDPHAIDKERVQGWIDQLKELPNAHEFLSVDKNTTVVVTDNIFSKNITDGNRDRHITDPGYAGFKQSRSGDKPLAIWINPVHPKDKVKVLIHEVLHVKHPGIAGPDLHSEKFYRKVYDALKRLGIEPDQAHKGPDGNWYNGEDTRQYNFDAPKADGDNGGAQGSARPDQQSRALDKNLQASDPTAAFGGRGITAADATKAALNASLHASAAATAVGDAIKQGKSNESHDPGSNVPDSPSNNPSHSPNGSHGGGSGGDHEPGEGGNWADPSQGGSGSSSGNGGGGNQGQGGGGQGGGGYGGRDEGDRPGPGGTLDEGGGVIGGSGGADSLGDGGGGKTDDVLGGSTPGGTAPQVNDQAGTQVRLIHLRALFVLFLMSLASIPIVDAKTSSQWKPIKGEKAMRNKNEKYEFIDMNCPHLKELQENIKSEFLKSPHIGELRQELLYSNNYNINDIKNYLSCFDGFEEGKESVSPEDGELNFINAKTSFAHVYDPNNNGRSVKIYLQIYIRYKNKELKHVNIMTNF